MKIAVVTGTRAEYELLRPLMHKMNSSSVVELQVVVTGTHLLPEFGSTLDDILEDGFTVSRKIDVISRAVDVHDVARQVGLGTVAFSDAFAELQSDAVVLLGDRYELLAAATAAFFLNVPIVHLHGGEVTRGAFDDEIRHTISRFARLHAVAAPEYAERLVRFGEHPDSVHVVGGLGVDAVHHLATVSRAELESELGVVLGDPLFVVTYHPVTSGQHDTQREIDSLLTALRGFPDATVIFTMPNADPEHRIVAETMQKAAAENGSWSFFPSLGGKRYLSLVAHASAVVGNSSSGLLEAPSLGTPTVNIGPRQAGRLTAASVVSCEPEARQIEAAIQRALSPEFRESIQNLASPYGAAGAVDRILNLLESTAFDTLEKSKNYA